MTPTINPTASGDIVQRSLATVLERAALPASTEPLKPWSFLAPDDENALQMEILRRYPNADYLTARPSLWRGIHPGFAGSVSRSPSPLAQIFVDVGALSSTHHLLDGSVPFKTYLENMIVLAGQQMTAPQSATPAFQTREVPEILRQAMAAVLAKPVPEGFVPNWSYLTTELTHPLASWLIANISDYPTHRARLFQDIHPGFVGSLAISSAPLSQILSDLADLNRTSHLSDGTVPLNTFLTNLLNLIVTGQ